MKQVEHPLYGGYPEPPYISPGRDLEEWANHPERYPYQRVARRQMQRLDEGILPGDLVLLWRVHFGTFTNETPIPEYFEYRYGVDSHAAIKTLLQKGYIRQCSAKQSLGLISLPVLRDICRLHGLPATGKKDMVVARIQKALPEKELAGHFALRGYAITTAGTRVLEKYPDIIQRHGPKG